MADDKTSAFNKVKCLLDGVPARPRTEASNNSISMWTLRARRQYVGPSSEAEEQLPVATQAVAQLPQGIAALNWVWDELHDMRHGH